MAVNDVEDDVIALTRNSSIHLVQNTPKGMLPMSALTNRLLLIEMIIQDEESSQRNPFQHLQS